MCLTCSGLSGQNPPRAMPGTVAGSGLTAAKAIHHERPPRRASVFRAAVVFAAFNGSHVGNGGGQGVPPFAGFKVRLPNCCDGGVDMRLKDLALHLDRAANIFRCVRRWGGGARIAYRSTDCWVG